MQKTHFFGILETSFDYTNGNNKEKVKQQTQKRRKKRK